MTAKTKKKRPTAPARLPVGLRRLLRLADFLDMVPRKKFDLGTWVGDDWRGKPDLSCGTTACALGWATTIPSFRRAGLRLVGDIPALRNGEHGFYAAASLFGITTGEATRLFAPKRGDDSMEEMRLPHTATPKQVAKHIRRFVQEKCSHVE